MGTRQNNGGKRQYFRQAPKKSSSLQNNLVSVVLVLALILIVIFCIIYLLFLPSGPIPSGEGLEKRDWLMFLGPFLSFAGSLLVGYIALWQNRDFAKREQDRQKKERQATIRPILLVSVVGLDEPERLSLGAHRSVEVRYPGSILIEIKNQGRYPISSIIVFENYVTDYLLPLESIRIRCGYEEAPDLLKNMRTVIQLSESEYEKTENGRPSWFNICYVDVDGDDWYQTFEYKEYNDVGYYALIGEGR